MCIYSEVSPTELKGTYFQVNMQQFLWMLTQKEGPLKLLGIPGAIASHHKKWGKEANMLSRDHDKDKTRLIPFIGAVVDKKKLHSGLLN